MTVKDLIKQLNELDPDGGMDIVVNTDRYDYPVSMGYPNIRYIDDNTYEWCGEDNSNVKKVISVTADN